MSILMTAALNLSVRFPDFPDAACIEADPEDFFPRSGGGYNAQVAYAKDICAGCPERLECLAWALEHDELGVWGGMSDLERRALRKRKPPITCAGCGVRFPDPGKPGPKPRRCVACRARREG